MSITSSFSSDNKSRRNKKTIEKQLAKEVKLLKEYDPDKELKLEWDIATLEDFQKYLADEPDIDYKIT